MDMDATALYRRQGASGPGSNQGAGPSSLSAMLSTLVPTFILAAVCIAIFLLLRRTQHRIYAPRTFVDFVPKQDHTPAPAGGMFGWIKPFKSMPDAVALRHQSLDAYLYIRFFKILVGICFVGCCITWPVLFPVNITGGGTESQLSQLSVSNVSDGNTNRFYAHAACACLFLGFVVFMVTRERIMFIGLRQAYYLSPLNAARLSSRTVLFLSVPKNDLSESRLRHILGPAVENVSIATDCKDLQDLVGDRDDAAMKLEGAIIKLQKLANKKRLKASKSNGHGKNGASNKHPDEEHGQYRVDYKARPTHKLKPLIGKKVDTINWSRQQLTELIPQVQREQNAHIEGHAEPLSAAFVTFATQSAAQRAFSQVSHHLPLQMSPRYIGVVPDDVIWKNLNVSWSRIPRTYVATAIITALVLFWSIPVAAVGAISNISYLIDALPFLSFINSIPQSILGVVTGLLPAVLLTILMILVPIFCRVLAKLAGEPTLSRVELKTQAWYFAFQVVQVFLVTTFSSGAAAVADQIRQNPTSAASLLGKNLPKASNFFIAYMILNGLTIAALQILSPVPLLLFHVLGRLLDKTPRKMYNRYISLIGLGWGSVYPKFTNLAVIAISYSCIAPLVCGFAGVGMLLLYLAFRYNTLFVFTTKIDTRGACYSLALQQLLTGVYISSLCLIGIFGTRTAWGPFVIMIVFLVCTVLVHISVNGVLSPLETSLPADIQADDEHEAIRALEDAAGQHNPGALDHHHGSEKPQVHHQSRQADHIGSRSDAYGSSPAHDLNANTTTATNFSRSGAKEGRSLAQPEYSTTKTPARHTQHHTQPQTPPKASFLKRFLKPHVYASYHALRPLLFDSSGSNRALPIYTRAQVIEAYLHPAIVSPPPVIWIVHDQMGISRSEIVEAQKVGIQMSDASAGFDEKNRIVWGGDREGGEGQEGHGYRKALQTVPIWEGNVIW